MSFGENMKSIRQQKGITQRELARRSGVSHQAINFIENGVRSPSEYTMTELASALGYSVSEMISDTTDGGRDASDLTAEEAQLLVGFRALNREGRAVVAATVRGLAGNPDMQKEATQPAAAS